MTPPGLLGGIHYLCYHDSLRDEPVNCSMFLAQSIDIAVQCVVVVGWYQALGPYLASHVNGWQRWRGRRVSAWTVGEA